LRWFSGPLSRGDLAAIAAEVAIRQQRSNSARDFQATSNGGFNGFRVIGIFGAK
jgi:hypothetical protein